MKVLVATDGSDYSMKAVQRALELAETRGADVTIMTVAYYAKDIMDEMPLNIQEKLEAEAKALLNKAKAVFDQKGVKVATTIKTGLVPANLIIRAAEEGKFDRIIIGSSGIHGLGRILMGSTAAKVVAQAPCEVTVVR
jgi:nucleotide-binding universal stress UspA family protein